MIEKDMNFIDTARGYTISEELIGKAICGKRHNFILATKSMSRTYEGMKKDIEISLTNLKTNYIDLYQLHNVQLTEDISGALQALNEAKEKGQSLVTLCSACHHVIKRVNDDMKNVEDIRTRANNYMQLEEPYAGETEVLHFLEVFIN